MTLLTESWRVKAKQKVANTHSKIPEEWRVKKSVINKAENIKQLSGGFVDSLLEEPELNVIQHDATQLSRLIQKGEFSALDVTLAFCKTAAVAHQINNCLHEIFFDEAIERAKYLDDYMKTHGKPIGPLHGLPVSLKDQFHVKGVDTSMGYIGWIGTYGGTSLDPKTVILESQIVKELLSLGAVLFCKTSLPQTLLFGETVNNLIGRTLNPVNQKLSCGGSSGGEGALQALRGSLMGLGGSVRIPAGFCGTCSVKPSWDRFSYRDIANTNPGQNTYPSTVGFMSPSLDSLELLLSSVLSTQPWLRDPAVVALPWRRQILDDTLARAQPNGLSNDKTPLKIGMFWTDGVVGPQPPVVRGLHILSSVIKKSGHKVNPSEYNRLPLFDVRKLQQVVDWTPPSQSTAKRVHLSFLKADGAHDIHTQLDLSGEPLIPQLEKTFKLREPDPLLTYQSHTLEGRAYELQYSDYWNTTGDEDGQLVDAVIMPVAPHAAVIPGKYYHTAYTEAINLLNYSVCVIPVCRADKNLDIVNKDYKPLNDIDQQNWEAYDPEVYDGAPVGLQVVGRKYEEEKVLAIAKIVTAALKSYADYPLLN
ncbi:MAG: hypothetical protein M1814_000572 [Vezdaea aestivalis]|nr:MAG: hypothetical protein M1814_000572 [Vezdaea aestivalis]